MSTRPTVYIARQLVAGGWTNRTTGKLAALASIRIPWGRATLTDPPAGHVATIVLLDTEAGYRRFENETLLGMRVEVRRTGDGVDVPLLVGTITEHSARRVRVKDPLTAVHVDRVELTISVSDTISVLSQRVRSGPYGGIQLYGTGGVPTHKVPGPWGYGGWPAQLARDRVAALSPYFSDLIPSYALPRISFDNPTSDPEYLTGASVARPAVDGHHRHEIPSVWDMLTAAYAVSAPLSWPVVIPGVSVGPGGPATSGERHLGTGPDGAYPMKNVFFTAGAGAWRFALDAADAYPSSSMADRIGTVSVPVARHEYRWQQRLTDAGGAEIRPDQLLDNDNSAALDMPVNLGGAASTTLDLAIATATATEVVPRTTSAENIYLSAASYAIGAWNAAVALRNETAAMLENLNNWLTLPPLEYRSWEAANSTNEYAAALQTWETGPIALQASQWHGIARAPRTVQFIGGTLTWEPRGWRHIITPAPTIDTARRDLAIGDLLGVDNPISSFASNVYVSDLPAYTGRSTAI